MNLNKYESPSIEVIDVIEIGCADIITTSPLAPGGSGGDVDIDW